MKSAVGWHKLEVSVIVLQWQPKYLILITIHLQRHAGTVIVVRESVTINSLIAIPIRGPPLDQLLANAILLQQLCQTITG